MSKDLEIDLPFRIGAALLAGVAGTAIGILITVVMAYFDWSDAFGRQIAGGAIAGALAGFLHPRGGMDFAMGTVHFFFGFLLASSTAQDRTQEIDPDEYQASGWLGWFTTFGVVFATVLWAASHF